MHGKFSAGGTSNEENPLAYVDLRDTTYYAFIDQNETGVGHLDGLLATDDELYVADISPDGGFGAADADEGVIYRVVSALAALPAPRFLTSDATIAGGMAPALDWDDVPGASTYALEYADNSGFTGLTSVTGLSSSAYTLPGPVADGTWYWRVYAVNGTTSAASSVVSFLAIPLCDPAALALLAAAMTGMLWYQGRRRIHG